MRRLRQLRRPQMQEGATSRVSRHRRRDLSAASISIYANAMLMCYAQPSLDFGMMLSRLPPRTSFSHFRPFLPRMISTTRDMGDWRRRALAFADYYCTRSMPAADFDHYADTRARSGWPPASTAPPECTCSAPR